MKLNELLNCLQIKNVKGSTDLEIKNLQTDSRQVKSGDLFIAHKGSLVDGHDYIDQAVENGAIAILYDGVISKIDTNITYVEIQNSSLAMGLLSSEWFGKPSTELTLVGVTGTNGKTTIATLLYKMFKHFGYKVGLISTISNFIDNTELSTSHTTPDSFTINKLLRQMVDDGCKYAFMEVSSHAIDQNRISGLEFAGGIFTNLTQDHLDYHHDMKEYLKAKKKFFDNLPQNAFALTNIDDKNGKVMLQNTKAKKYDYSLKNIADFKGKIIERRFDSTTLEINNKEVDVQFVGLFNIYNLLAVCGATMILGQSLDNTLLALSLMKPVTGRFETFHSPDGFVAIVDYAHTPDAVSNVLDAISGIIENDGKLITVVGCGGNRDRTKRPLMAQEAHKRSDKLILTSDNPRFEDPMSIINDMSDGLNKDQLKNTLLIEDRRQAIKTAIALAQKGDVILIAGKGHEDYQDIKGVKHHFSDKEEVLSIINS